MGKYLVAETRKSDIVATTNNGKTIAVTEYYQGRVKLPPKIRIDTMTIALADVIMHNDLYTLYD